MQEPAINTIHNIDCISGMQQLVEGSVDLAFADPPFNIGYEYDVYDDRREYDQYLGWSRQWIGAVHRALKPTGSFWLAIGDEYAAELKMISQEIGFHCRSWVIWYYTFGVNCTRKFSRSHAHLFHFVKHRKKFTFNGGDRAVRVPSARQLVYSDDRANPNGRLPDDTWVLRPQDLPEGFREDGDTWFFSRVAGTFKERAGFHGCQMPEQLLGRIIRVSSNAGDHPDLVLDPFSGSATTLVVAKKLGRNFVGFDVSADYVKRGRARLAAVSSGDALEGPPEPLLSAPPTPGRSPAKQNGRKENASPSLNGNAPIAVPRLECLERLDCASLPERKVETERAIVQAYRDACQGFSVDRMLSDDSLRSAFSECCSRVGIPGTAEQWNRALVQTRKAGRLAGVPTKKRTDFDWMSAERFLFASEIALRTMCDEGHSLDAVLCDPALLARFDETAREFAPGFTTFEYRWAALKIRKISKEALRQSRQKVDLPILSRRTSVLDFKVPAFRGVAGLYLITDQSASDRVYAGMTFDLSLRIESLTEGGRLRNAWLRYASSAFVQYITVDNPARRFFFKSGLFSQQERMVERFRPRLNFGSHLVANEV